MNKKKQVEKKKAKMEQMMKSVDGETSEEEEEECQDATNEEKCRHRDKSKRKMPRCNR